MFRFSVRIFAESGQKRKICLLEKIQDVTTTRRMLSMQKLRSECPPALLFISFLVLFFFILFLFPVL